MFSSSFQDSSTLTTARDEMQNGALCQLETIVYDSKKFEDDLQTLGSKIKQHEDNIKNLKTEKNSLDESILDLQASQGKNHSLSAPTIKNANSAYTTNEEETVDYILRHDKSAAGILCKLKTRHSSQASHLPLTKDVIGIVATLGKIDDENLSRLLSEYLGMETMLAVVCKTCDGVRSLETYEKTGLINKSSGLHGLGASIGRPLDDPFQVICLEYLRPYYGEFIADDPQQRLDLLKPRMTNGELPPGFLGFAVNMIDIDRKNVFCVTSDGHGLRETLFYNLFSHLQVYRTRAEMLQALPCISEGAISLDGGIIKEAGVFSLGNREVCDLKFPKNSAGISTAHENNLESETRMKEILWKKEKLREELQLEEELLHNAKLNFELVKLDFLKFLADSSSRATTQT